MTNDLQRHNSPLRDELADAMGHVLDRGWFIGGPELEAFEREFAAWCGVANCCGTGNGTDAVELALRAAGVGKGSRVANVANAGMYATTAILACGAIPVWVDVDPCTFNMNAAALAEVDVDCVVVTHLYGQMAPMPDILHAARGVPVIEDCAQAHGAVLGGRAAGSWGIAGCFSFYPTKNLGALGDAGAVVTNDLSLAERVRSLRQYGWTAKYVASHAGGQNSRMDELQAAVLRVKLRYVEGWNRRRREISNLYGFTRRPADSGDVVHLYVIRSPRRDACLKSLRAASIGADVHYPVPDYRQEAVRSRLGDTRALTETERACAEVLTLPCFPEMTDAEVLSVAETFRRVTETC